MIPFNIPTIIGTENNYINDVIRRQKLSGDGFYTKKCHDWFESKFSIKKTLLTTSCTHALEMSAILCDIKPGDEVIMPSFTFVSTANAFALRGAKIVFIDIRPDTMNMNELLIEQAITSRTKAIIPVHYAGVACEMNLIMDIARRYNIKVIEDAAQGVMSKYEGKYLGSIGHLGCYSFHETKNYNCGEGGSLLINDNMNIERAEIIREKGTNRSRFFRGQVDKYTWVDIGSSYLPSEINAAFLFAQLEAAEQINTNRLKSWTLYYRLLESLSANERIILPTIPENCKHNAHMFYIKVRDLKQRTEFIEFLKSYDVSGVFHYVPLHSSEAGLKLGAFSGNDIYTSSESDKLVRLPMYYNLPESDINKIVDIIYTFFQNN